MKGCAIAFNIIGMIGTLIVSIANLPIAAQVGLSWMYIVLIILCLIFGIASLVTLGNNTKSVFVGVMCLLFNGLIGGILYLCWNPDRY